MADKTAYIDLFTSLTAKNGHEMLPFLLKQLPDGTYTIGIDASATAYAAAAATVALGQSLSGEVDTGGKRLAGIVMPAAWTAAAITFQAASALAANGGVYRDLYDDQGNEVTVQAAAGRALGLDSWASTLAPWRFLKIRSGTGASVVNQAADAVLALALKG